jgi:uroporphyrinogen decarboxylase
MRKEMSHCERVFAALERREPDRVPIFELVIAENVMQGIYPGCTYYDFVERIGLDVVGLNRSSWRKDNVQFVDKARGLFRDQWGVIRAFGPESSPYPVEAPIKRPEDLRTYTPPDPNTPGALGHLPEVVHRYKGKRPVIWLGRDAFFDPAHLRGMEDFLMDFILNPGLAHELIEICEAYDIAITRRAVRAGADIVVFGDDYADKNAPMMSPRHFAEFIQPGLTKAVAAAHDEGAYVIKHTDGNIMPIIEMIIETGIDALHPIEPAAGMDIGYVKRKYGDRVCIVGNIDCGELLSRRPVEEVVAAVKQCIRDAAPGGGYMISSSNSIHSSVRPENYKALVETARAIGRYPIPSVSP